jgi:hypothetical protein
MLSRLENRIMGAIYQRCKGTNAVLIEKNKLMPITGENSEDKLDKIVNDLYTDGFFDLVYTERQGEKVYCITLTEKGKGYPRESKLVKRTLMFKLVVSVGFAIFSFILGLILKAIFN